MVIIYLDKTVSETAAALQAAVQANHFGVMQVHNLEETMTKKGVEFAHECLIFEVCQPQQAKKLLDQNMMISDGTLQNMKTTTTTLTPEPLEKMDASWPAASYRLAREPRRPDTKQIVPL
jgi:hypothetical protein